MGRPDIHYSVFFGPPGTQYGVCWAALILSMVFVGPFRCSVWRLLGCVTTHFGVCWTVSTRCLLQYWTRHGSDCDGFCSEVLHGAVCVTTLHPGPRSGGGRSPGVSRTTARFSAACVTLPSPVLVIRSEVGVAHEPDKLAGCLAKESTPALRQLLPENTQTHQLVSSCCGCVVNVKQLLNCFTCLWTVSE